MARAQKYLSKMPASSSQRALAEIKVATGLWNEISKAKKTGTPDAGTPNARAMKVKAVEALMTRALSRIKPEDVNYAALVGMLSLRHIAISSASSRCQDGCSASESM